MKSIITSVMNRCYLCGSYQRIEIHHIYSNCYRKKSTKYGLVVPLCYECHQGINGVHHNRQKMDYLRAIGQAKFEEEMTTLAARKASVEDECKKIENELNDYKEKQTAINEAILRQRAIDEQQDFYKINLSERVIHDVKILNSIKNELIDKNEIDKLIYSVYYSKPSMEMIKKVLGGKAPCGIYKITRLKTGEIYIGKSTDVKSRWQQHIKTACNCGNIAHSQLHTTMQKDGIENFTFELLEEVAKDKLSEREKYWINFYNSKQYGLNEKNG